MMIQSTQTDARRINFTSVGRDQHNVYQTIHITVAGLNPEQTLRRLLPSSDPVSQSTSRPGTSSRRGVLARAHHPSAEYGSVGDTAASLIVKIVQLLIESKTCSDDSHRFKLELETLHKTLALTGLAVQTYQHTPLGRVLVDLITPKMAQCFVVLQELLHKIKGFRQGLHPTSIHYLWRQVLWSGWSEDEFASLRTKLLEIRESLARFLMALHSYVLIAFYLIWPVTEHYFTITQSVAWTDIGDRLRAGHAFLDVFHGSFIRHLPFLGHIKLDTVRVVDHLGQNIPVPTIFCSTWQVCIFLCPFLASDH
jgi:hypothetical protein